MAKKAGPLIRHKITHKKAKQPNFCRQIFAGDAGDRAGRQPCRARESGCIGGVAESKCLVGAGIGPEIEPGEEIPVGV